MNEKMIETLKALEERAAADPALADEVVRRLLSGNGIPCSGEVAEREIAVLRQGVERGDPAARDELIFLAEKTTESLDLYERMLADAARD